MATTYTPNANLQKPAASDRNWDAPLNANADALDGLAAVGALAVAPAENPSASLNIKVAPGVFRASDRTFVAYAGTPSWAVNPSGPNYVYLDDAGALHVADAGWPATPHVRLAVVTAGATTVTAVADARVPWATGGTSKPVVAEGANAALGTAVLVAGTITVTTTQVTANSRIFLTTQVPGGTPGTPYVSARVAGTSFTITSTSGADTSTVAWLLVEPA